MPEAPAGDQPHGQWAPDLFASNTPEAFWRPLLEPPASSAEWVVAVRAAAHELPGAARATAHEISSLLFNTLGEGQFGAGHFRLSRPRRAYYAVKPLLPRGLTTRLRGLHRGVAEKGFALGWPSEPRFARFLYSAAGHLARARGLRLLPHVCLWPEGRRFAFVLTHDIETAAGQRFASRVADLDQRLGFRSSFNFVAEGYPLDRGLIDELRSRGFEIGVHGCRHDGKLFSSHRTFTAQAARINRHLEQLGATGFRSPLTHRHPAWMQQLDIEYDSSFFDTDPYEPMPGGVMALWPFRIGRFIELPYTLAQDHTLASVLRQTSPKLWLEKLEVIRSFGGMALLNTHPDYLRRPNLWTLYERFLETMSDSSAEYWHALPAVAARWWRERAESQTPLDLHGARRGMLEVPTGSETLPRLAPARAA